MSTHLKSSIKNRRGSHAEKTSPPAVPISNQRKRPPAKADSDARLERSKAGATDFIFYINPTLTLVCVPADAPVLFSLGDTADLTGVHPDMLRYYARAGLIEVRCGKLETDLLFDETALHEIRRIEHYRRHLGVGRRALPLLCELQRESSRQRINLHFLRYP